MGASREMTVGLLVEPALMLVVFSVAVAGGTTDLGELAARRDTLAGLSWQAPDLLALLALLILVPAETGRIPVDNPDTHLELTMLHEGMLLEHSGPGLACIVLATHTKQLVILTLVAALFFPVGPGPGRFAARSLGWRSAPSPPRCSRWRPSWAWSSLPTPSCASSGCPSSWDSGCVCAFLALALRML